MKVARLPFITLAIGIALLGTTSSQAGSVVLHGTVPAELPAMSVPVAIPLPAGEWERSAIEAEVSFADGKGSVLPAQYEPANPVAGTPARAWVVLKTDEAVRGKRVRVEIRTRTDAFASAYKTERAEPLVKVRTADGANVFDYYYGAPQAGSIPPLTDYVHPLYGLDGEVLTDLRPRDHLHHRGVFWPWVRHERNGKSLGDWWHPMQMTLEPTGLSYADGPVFTGISARHTWVSRASASDSPEPFVDEQVAIRAFPATRAGRAIDIDVTITATEDGIRIGGTLELKKGYGGMSIRFAPAKAAEVVADGKKYPKDANHVRASWADWSGRIASRQAASAPAASGVLTDRSGASIFIHPSHPDMPPEWITRPYGVIGLAFPGIEMMELPKDKPLRMRYRIWVHRGGAADGQVAEAYKAYTADWKWEQK